MRALKWIFGIIGGLIAIAAILWFTPTSDYVILPGITENLNDVIQVQNGQPPRGRLLMVAVTLEPANLFYLLYGTLTPYGEVVPANQVTGPGGSSSQYQKESELEMSSAQQYAKVAALDYLGYKTRETGHGVLVYYDLPHYPADGKIKSGDLIVAVNRTPVSTASDLLTYMDTRVKPGETVSLEVVRHGKHLAVSLGTKRNPNNPKEPLIGVAIGTSGQSFDIPVPISIHPGDVSGPSAGMMFSLEIISQLRPSWHLAHGVTVAGTGQITPSGQVQAIGGIREKVITVYDSGAKVFLVPEGNYTAALQEERELGIVTKMPLIKVRTLASAVSALRNLNLQTLRAKSAKLAGL